MGEKEGEDEQVLKGKEKKTNNDAMGRTCS